MLLEKINCPNDVKKLNTKELNELAKEMRQALLNRLSKKGGHFGPNFGMVEAIIALHYVFESPKDKFVFDVSHQSYPHKMLTGRKDAYLYEEHFKDISGYTNPQESKHDFFNVGHTSTSISLASGLAKARDLKGDNENIIAIIGDGSLSGGEALEGLDFVGSELNSNFIILVNDNDMSIAENHGGLYKNLKNLRESNGTCECNLFKAMGLDYVYQEEGNNIEKLIETFEKVKNIDHSIVVHINTQKGKGYKIAEENKENWHYCAPFDVETGKPMKAASGENYSALTCDYLLEKMKKDPKVIAVIAATPKTIGFTEEKRKLAGKQFVDVGIAEEHAVAMVSGIAKNGGSVYGMSDVTHLGIFDIPLISNIPNMVYLAPTSKQEYFAMLDWSIEQNQYPVAIRIPGNGVISDNRKVDANYDSINQYKVEQKGSKVAILAVGDFYQLGKEVAKAINEKIGIAPTLINPRYISGLDKTLLEELKQNHELVITLEDGVLEGGFGEKIASYYGTFNMKVKNYGIRKSFPDRYVVEELLKENGISVEQIVEDIEHIFSNSNMTF